MPGMPIEHARLAPEVELWFRREETLRGTEKKRLHEQKNLRKVNAKWPASSLSVGVLIVYQPQKSVIDRSTTAPYYEPKEIR